MAYCLRDKVNVELTKSQLNHYRFGMYALIRETEEKIKKEKSEDIVETYKDMIAEDKKQIAFIETLLQTK